MNCYKCNHPKDSHKSSLAYPGEFYCYDCFMNGKGEVESYHKFPDNLDIIEHLAKERNLI